MSWRGLLRNVSFSLINVGLLCMRPRTVSLHDGSPYRREQERQEKHRGQKHGRRMDSPVTGGQAAGEDVGGVDGPRGQ